MKPTKEPGPFMKIALAKAFYVGREESITKWLNRPIGGEAQPAAELKHYTERAQEIKEQSFLRRIPEPERVTKEELRWGWPVQGSVS